MIRDPDRLIARELLKQVLRVEKGLREYRPTHRPYTGEVPPPPPFAEQVLTALVATYPPGTAIGLQQVCDAIAVTWEQARAVRAWAEATKCWPWPRPGACRPAGEVDRLRAPRKEGGGRR